MPSAARPRAESSTLRNKAQYGSVGLSKLSKVSWMNWQDDDVTSPKSDRLHSVLKRSLFTKRLFVKEWAVGP